MVTEMVIQIVYITAYTSTQGWNETCLLWPLGPHINDQSTFLLSSSIAGLWPLPLRYRNNLTSYSLEIYHK